MTAHTVLLPNGRTCIAPNRVTEKSPDLYVSYNATDSAHYGCATTAVVVGQMKWCFILCGNHEIALAGKSWEEWLEYLHANAAQRHKFSDALPARGTSLSEVLDTPHPISLRLKERRY